MTKLPESSMKILKKISESTRHLPPGDRLTEHESARMVLAGLRVAMDDLNDDQLGSVSFALAHILAALITLPVGDLVETLENSTRSYTLVAAHLMGLYDVNDDPKAARKGGAKGESDTAEYVPGGYL